MSILKVILLGVIQGLTEFLPVSSSGHLVLTEFALGVKKTNDLSFEVLLHFATLMAILAYFVPKWWEERHKISSNIKEIKNYIIYIIIATIPAGIVGLLFEDYISKLFERPSIVGLMLIFTSVILYAGSRFGIERYKKITLLIAIVVGLSQSLAIIPGISRSGITISTALLLGLNRNESANFSFMIAIPVILGAFILELPNIVGINPIIGIVGFISAFIAGYIAIGIVFKTLLNRKFIYFSYYCLIVGILTMIFS